MSMFGPCSLHCRCVFSSWLVVKLQNFFYLSCNWNKNNKEITHIITDNKSLTDEFTRLVFLRRLREGQRNSNKMSQFPIYSTITICPWKRRCLISPDHHLTLKWVHPPTKKKEHLPELFKHHNVRTEGEEQHTRPFMHTHTEKKNKTLRKTTSACQQLRPSAGALTHIATDWGRRGGKQIWTKVTSDEHLLLFLYSVYFIALQITSFILLVSAVQCLSHDVK